MKVKASDLGTGHVGQEVQLTAEQLLRLIDNPPPAQEMVRRVCCRTV